MNEGVRAEILVLSGNILLGRIAKGETSLDILKEIERVSKLAIKNGEFEFFKQEIKDCDHILRGSSQD